MFTVKGTLIKKINFEITGIGLYMQFRSPANNTSLGDKTSYRNISSSLVPLLYVILHDKNNIMREG